MSHLKTQVFKSKLYQRFLIVCFYSNNRILVNNIIFNIILLLG